MGSPERRRLAVFIALVLGSSCTLRRATPGESTDGGAPDGGAPDGGAPAASVLEYHNGPGRNGVYIDAGLTKTSAATFHVDPSFHATVSGNIYAQPLFFASGPGGKALVLVATELNTVYALDASSGSAVWTRPLGPSVPGSQLPCGNIDPLGVTGTPVIDPAGRTLFVAALTTPDGGVTKKHLIYAISLDDGSVRPGWPVDVSASASTGSLAFDSSLENQRGALGLVGGRLYVPYGGHYGDCGAYHGWLIGVAIANPADVKAWATGLAGGGAWAVGGVASDGSSLYLATGNTQSSPSSSWGGGDALLRFSTGPSFSGSPVDYFAPSDWQTLDAGDLDLGGTGPLVVDVPGATPAQVLVGLGKDGKVYLANRTNLGGVGGTPGIAVASGEIIGAAAAYATSNGTYVVFWGSGLSCPSGQSGDLTALRIYPGAQPPVSTAWCALQNGGGSPMVTTTDGRSEAIVWSVGAEGDERLHGFDGDTGAVVFGGGGPGDAMGKVQHFQTPILAGGRIFVAADGAVVAFVR